MSSNPHSNDLLSKSIEYYNQNADSFFNDTVNLDMNSLYKPFLRLLPDRATILDAGCGSGRDTLYFLDKGYHVVAFDASASMVELATKLTGQHVLKLSFFDVNFQEEFDGIWACASLLHIPKELIENALTRLSKSLKPGGIFYASFRHGSDQAERNGRWFNDYNQQSFTDLVSKFPEFKPVLIWIARDLRPDRSKIKWLNVILRKEKPLLNCITP